MVLEEIKKDIEKYESKSQSMSSTIGLALFLTIVFVLYILVPDVIISICKMIANWLETLINEKESDYVKNYLLQAGSDIFNAVISSRKEIGDLKGTLTAIPVIFSALFIGSYANYRLLQQHIHELNLKKYGYVEQSNISVTNEKIT